MMIDLNAFVPNTATLRIHGAARRVSVGPSRFTCRAFDAVAPEVDRVLLVGESALLQLDLVDTLRHARSLGLAVEVLTAPEDLTAERMLLLADNGVERVRVLVRSGRHSSARLHHLLASIPLLVPLDIHYVVSAAQGWLHMERDLQSLDLEPVERLLVSGAGHRFDQALPPWSAFAVASTLFEMVIYGAPLRATLCVEGSDFADALLVDAQHDVNLEPVEVFDLDPSASPPVNLAA